MGIMKNEGHDPNGFGNTAAYQRKCHSMGQRYPHMCRDVHVQIGHSDSEHEMCPLCRANAKAEHLRDGVYQSVQALKMLYMSAGLGQTTGQDALAALSAEIKSLDQLVIVDQQGRKPDAAG